MRLHHDTGSATLSEHAGRHTVALVAPACAAKMTLFRAELAVLIERISPLPRRIVLTRSVCQRAQCRLSVRSSEYRGSRFPRNAVIPSHPSVVAPREAIESLSSRRLGTEFIATAVPTGQV